MSPGHLGNPLGAISDPYYGASGLGSRSFDHGPYPWEHAEETSMLRPKQLPASFWSI